jgi:hypothetical protein
LRLIDFNINSSQVNYVSDGSLTPDDENEGIIGRKYCALKPYIKKVGPLKDNKEQ